MQWFLKGLGYGLMAGGWVLGFSAMMIIVGSIYYGIGVLGEWLEEKREGGNGEKE